MKTKKQPAGKVIRVPADVWELIQAEKRDGEKISRLIRRLLKKEKRERLGETFFICPSAQIVISDCKDKAEARGKVIVMKKKLIEEPILVREVI